MKKVFTKLIALTLLMLLMTVSADAATSIDTITIDGVSYTLPCRLEAFIENGWRIGTDYQEWIQNGYEVDRIYRANDTVPSGSFCMSLRLEKNGMSFGVLLGRNAQSKKLSRFVVNSTSFCKYNRMPSIRYLGVTLDWASPNEIGRAVRSAGGNFVPWADDEAYAELGEMYMNMNFYNGSYYEMHIGLNESVDF